MIKWLERLSLDAVIVAVVWGYVLGDLGGKIPDWKTLLVLALSTWLTYVADRLRDVGKRGGVPETDRHLYYKNNYRIFSILWIALFMVDLIVAWFILPEWKILWGIVLVSGIIAYLSIVRRIAHPSVRIAFKRLAVPLIFTAGVCLMSESWHSTEGVHGSLILLLGSISNLVLISWWEDQEKKMPWLLPVWIIFLMTLIACGLPGLIGAACFALIGWLCQKNRGVPLRAMADGVLVIIAGIL